MPLLKEISPTDLAYIAGIIDGEGCLRFSKLNGRKTFELVEAIRVKMTCKEIIDWLKDTTGVGFIYQDTLATNRRTAFVWCVNGKRAVELAMLLLPHLKLKQHQASLFSIYRHTVGKQGSKVADANILLRINLSEWMRQLNSGGIVA